MRKNELFVAKDKNEEVLGFYRVVMDVTFLMFAYLHLIAVRMDMRGSGIGFGFRHMFRLFFVNQRHL